MTLTEFLLARLAEVEASARACAEAFPSPWEVADRGWRVRIYAADVPDIGDHAEPGDTRAPCVIEVEPQRHHRELNDGGWLSDRVEHIARHDPARVLADVEAKRRIVHHFTSSAAWSDGGPEAVAHFAGFEQAMTFVLRKLAAVYADHPDFDRAWCA